jgi:hypothetical protein
VDADLVMALSVSGVEDAAVYYNMDPDYWLFKCAPFTYVPVSPCPSTRPRLAVIITVAFVLSGSQYLLTTS